MSVNDPMEWARYAEQEKPLPLPEAFAHSRAAGWGEIIYNVER
jgi:hypothetical protein